MTEKSKYKWPKVFTELFITSGKSSLNSPPNGPVVRKSKIQNRHLKLHLWTDSG